MTWPVASVIITAIAAVLAIIITMLRGAAVNWDWARSAAVVCAVGTLLFFLIVFYLFSQVPSDQITDLAPARQVIMFAMIMAMLIFGGVLIIRPLSFAGIVDDDVQQKFRMSREIFLIFSSIFATVVGFYFGGSTISSGSTGSTANTFGVKPAFEDGALAITILGGSPPYENASLVDPSHPERLQTLKAKEDSKFVLAPEDAPSLCPSGMNIAVRGANGNAYPAVALTLTREEFAKNGWEKQCGAEVSGSATSAASEPTPENTGT